MTDNETARGAARVSKRWPLVSGAFAVLLVAGIGAIIAYREGNLPLEFDTEFMAELVENRAWYLDAPALLLNHFGGGFFGVIVLPVLIIVGFCAFRRFWSAAYFLIATVASAGVVQVLKNIFDRPRPEDILVVSDVGSFPSGHVANAATMAVVLGFIFRRLWVWIAGLLYTIVMLLSRTYLGAHWLSDTLGGFVLGSAIAVIVWAPLAYRLHVERRTAPDPLFIRPPAQRRKR